MVEPEAAPSATTVELSERAQDKRPTVPLNVKAPASVDVRLDQLCDLLDQGNHARPSRDLLVSALIHAAETDLDALERCLTGYRGATHADVLIGKHQKKGELDLAPLKEAAKSKNA